jgi:hypothetical protein
MTLRILPLFLAAATLAAQESAAPAPQKFDFQSLQPGELPDDYMSTDQEAKFSIVADGENKLLELAGQPIVDGGVLVGKSIKGACTVTARIMATGKRRTHPRFGVGLHGISGPRLLVVPAEKCVKIVRNTEKEETVASVPYTWTSGTWTRLEFSIKPAADGKSSTLEARVWEEGKPRPEAPTLTWENPDPPAQGKASVWGAPYAELPIRFDDIEVK